MTLTRILIVITCLFSAELYTQNIVSDTDLKIILGNWTGTLTYIDYSSNKPYTMPANLEVKQDRNKNHFLLFNSYPKEPKANNDKIRISKNGTLLNGHSVESNQVLSNGQTQIITEYDGKDNKQKAVIRMVYILGKNQFVIRKEVKYENSEVWSKRNEYNYNR